jgi:CubicO group peptidase (beta-lactamase class C family)
MLATITGMMNVAMGQLGFLMALLMTVAWLADRERRPVVAGLAIGVAMYAKVFLGVFLVYLLWRRAWRTLGFSMIGFAFMALVGLVAGGWDVHRAWLGTLSGISWLPNPLNASLTGIIERTLHGGGRWILVLLEGGVLAVLAFGIAKYDDTDRSWAMLLFGSLLLSPLGWMYYIPMALGPVVALWYRGGARTRWLIAGGVLLLCVHPPESGSVFYSLTRGSVYAWAVVLFLLAALYAPKPREALSDVRPSQ